jgi:hypothetical protein
LLRRAIDERVIIRDPALKAKGAFLLTTGVAAAIAVALRVGKAVRVLEALAIARSAFKR